METCFVYLRKSTNREGKQELSLSKQQAWVERTVESRNYLDYVSIDGTIHEFPQKAYIFESASAKEYAKQRPLFQRMLELIREKGVDWVIVYNPDRISRNNRDMTDFMEIFNPSNERRKAGGFIRKGVITNIGTYLANNLNQIQAFENRLNEAKNANSERSLETKENQRFMKEKLGIYPHRFPFWYKTIWGRAKGAIRIDTEEADLVYMAFRMRIEGCGYTEIAKEFCKKGFKKNAKGVSNILSNPLYYGAYEFEGKTYPVKNDGYTTMVSKPDFDAVAKYNAENPWKHRKSNLLLPKEDKRPLDKMVFDFEGQFLQGYLNKKRGGIYYKQSKGATYKVNISEAKLFKEANNQINRFQLPPQFSAIVEMRLRFRLRECFKQEALKMKSLEHEIEQRETQIDGLVDMIGKGDDDLIDNYKKNVRKHKDRKNELEAELEVLRKNSKDPDAIAKRYAEYFRDLPKTFSQVSKKEKADILCGLGVAFVVSPDKNITVLADEFEKLFTP